MARQVLRGAGFCIAELECLEKGSACCIARIVMAQLCEAACVRTARADIAL